ncbi:tetratricopeptide repeat protein [Novosphingobium beihaiensis]|uniref:Tetratricopeptide repeat protein n=1 Tax=Novosphingobium beihaiensis TaxID=2930389 RepID=A0ABT0BPJ2_9SPHN|nr:tetratricopeptide repeat protein [Novosphingobium beihaiensis]MCJ2186977.1 tetratricopeptide repeat protein [Novosphingobium beihaiensis]
MTGTDARTQFEKLKSYLEHDPENANLLRDSAEAALEAGMMPDAHSLYAKLEQLSELDERDRANAGLAAMRSGHASAAADHFLSLLETHPGDPALTYNLAHSMALAGEYEAAAERLDDATVDALPQAAMLRLQLVHQDGEFEAAQAMIPAMLERHGHYGPLLAAVSVLAMDTGDEDLARRCAEQAGELPDAITTLATLKLGEHDPRTAQAMFLRALALNPGPQPRAVVGLGLAAMASGDLDSARTHLDRGAALFTDHLGSWIASGWVHLLAGDRTTARERFQHALDLDPNFAESHGSLAVVELLEGEPQSARRRIDMASRLDRASFAAALARSMDQAVGGDTETAKRILEMAMTQPIDEDGRTLAEALSATTLAAKGRDFN